MLLLWIPFVPETHATTLLSRKARQLQLQAQEERTGVVFTTKADQAKRGIRQTILIGLSRPIAMLFREVIVLALSVYREYKVAPLSLFSDMPQSLSSMACA